MARMRPKKITVHTTGVEDEASFEAIRRYHVEVNGWSDIGYHFYVENEEKIHTGRSLETKGAHVGGHNTDNIGIAFEGDGDVEYWTPFQWEKGIDLIVSLCRMFDIPASEVRGHREFPGVDKTCPGKLIDMDKIRAEVARRLQH